MPLNPRLAFGWSLVMPGAGQLYNGDGYEAVLHFGLFAGSIVILKSAVRVSFGPGPGTQARWIGANLTVVL